MVGSDSQFDDLCEGPSFELEAAEMALGRGPIAGVDEAGRGPWAGPVVAAAVILDRHAIPPGLDDSKAMDAASRERAYAAIMATARVGVGVGCVARIDRDNILQATMFAMAEAVAGLSEVPGLVLIDGNTLPKMLPCAGRAIVRGDALCLSIAAASIVAKVTRDRMMVSLAAEFPGYGFERHKGYGVPEHKIALAKLGVTPLHRRSFKPIQLVLNLAGTEVQADALQGGGASLGDIA
jgi:ribonuclease HII